MVERMPEQPVNPFTRWSEIASGTGGAAEYQERFDRLESEGVDVHGEARFVARLVPVGSRVLDAGCGTGRVAIELHRLGYRVVGVDADLGMVEHARHLRPDMTWVHADLASLYLRTDTFDLTVLAGNVVPLLAPGSLFETMRRIAMHTEENGLVVAGFGLDVWHLPDGCPVTSIEDYDRACAAAGLAKVERHSTWEGGVWGPGAGYVVAVHRRL